MIVYITFEVMTILKYNESLLKKIKRNYEVD
jgi:hypothetical protein